MNRAQRNHNPGNLVFVGQRLASGKDDRGFCMFKNPIKGWLSLIRQIKLDQSRGMTINDFIHKYAPPSENMSNAYSDFIARGLRAKKSDKLSDFSPYAIAGLIAAYEGYFNDTEEECKWVQNQAGEQLSFGFQL